MANYRLATILAEESATTAGTKTIDLDLVNPISRISIVFRPTNSNQTMVAHPAKCISKIEIVDGSDVLYSASAMETRAIAYYGTGIHPVDVLDYNISSECMFQCNLYFGRYLNDPQLALDPKRFKNLQLKITHNKALGGATPTTATLAVYANVFDDKPVSPMGFLMTKEQYSYLPTASAHEFIDLATDYPYRQILVCGPSDTKMPMWRINTVKLSEDFDRKLPIPETHMDDMLQGIVSMYPPIMDHIIAQIATSETDVWMTAGYEGSAVCSPYGDTHGVCATGNGGGGHIHAYAEAASTYWIYAKGWCPHNFVALPICDPNDISDFYNVTGLKSLRLDILADSSPGTSDNILVVTQQLRRY